MRILTVLDKQDYDPQWNRFFREAVRAIILHEGMIALVRNLHGGYYKFPGGGIEAGESHIDTLIRETYEETGLHILPSSVRAFGMVHELRKSLIDPDMIFEQKSYSYRAGVAGQMLDGYEAEEGSVLEWTDIRKAYEINTVIATQRGDLDFLFREAEVLKLLLLQTQEQY